MGLFTRCGSKHWEYSIGTLFIAKVCLSMGDDQGT